VACVGVVAVHPNGNSLVGLPARLGQATDIAALVRAGDARPAAIEPPQVATATTAPMEDASKVPVSAAVSGTVSTSAPANPTPGHASASVVEPFRALVTQTHTSSAAVAEAGAYIENEGAKEALAANVRALNLASDRLAFAEAESNKAEQDVQRKEIETQAAELAVRNAAVEAQGGSFAETLEDTAKVETAGLAENKRSYLLTRGEYEASTVLEGIREHELASATKNTEDAKSNWETALSIANAAKTAADAAAVAAREHLVATKNAAVVGEETFLEGVTRSQEVAQITSAATTLEIKAGDLKIAAADAKRRVDEAALVEKTVSETLDAEFARNAELKLASNANQKTFIDASDLAAKDATAAADAGKKAKDTLESAHITLATARDALSKARETRERLKYDILAARAAEYESQVQKTTAVRAMADVSGAVSTATAAATEVENVKQNTVRDAKVATVVSKFDEAAAVAQKDKLAETRSAGIEFANAISAQAAGMTMPEFHSEAVPVASSRPSVETASEATPEPYESASVAETVAPETAAVASVGERPSSVALNQAKAKSQSKAREERAIRARMAVIQAQMAARSNNAGNLA
jgi:hypothetical protein